MTESAILESEEVSVSKSLTLSPSERAELLATLRKIKSDGNRFHVISSRGHWAVVSENRPRRSEVFGTKEAAVERGRALARNSGGELVVHDRNAHVRERESFRQAS